MSGILTRRSLLTGAAALAAYASLPANAAVPGIGASLLGGGGKLSLMQILTKAGFASNVKCCFDVGSADSYPGSGSTIFDLSGNGNNWTNGPGTGDSPTIGTFHGSAGGLSPNEYLASPSTKVSTTTYISAPVPASGADLSFANSWHTAAANFTVVLGFKIPASWTVGTNLFQTGIWFFGNRVEYEKGFALYRVNDSGSGAHIPAFANGKGKRLYLAANGSHTSDDDNYQHFDTGLLVPNNTFVLLIAAITSSAQRVRINDSSVSLTNSFGTGDSSSDSVFFPNYSLFANQDDSETSQSGLQYTCGALLDGIALSSAQSQSVYLLFKKYRDHTLP